MKKIIFNTLALITFLTLIFVSCEKDDSEKHEYTPEELAEIRRQDSLKQIIPASYIFTQEVTVPVNKGYEGVTVQLCPDTAKLLEKFEYNTVAELVAALGTLEGGVQAGNDIIFYAYNYSTKYEYTSPSTTNYFGHWFDANGDVCNWGDQAHLFCEKQDETTLKFTIGIFPDRPVVGTVYKIVEAMKYDTTKVAFLFTVTIGPKEGLPVTTVVGTQTLSLEAEAAADWVDNVLDFDTLAITNAIGCVPEDAEIFGVNLDGSLYDGSFTANNGFWFNRSGEICSWGSEAIAMYCEYRTDDQKIGVGQMPDSCFAGQTYSARIAFVNLTNLKQYNVVVNMTVTEPEVNPYPETELVGTQNLSASADTLNDYTPTVMALDTAAVSAALGSGPAGATLYGVNADDSLYIDGFTANNGCWFSTSGDVCNWGTEGCVMAAEYDPVAKVFNVYQFPDGPVSGQTYTCKMAFVFNSKRYVVVIALTVDQNLK